MPTESWPGPAAVRRAFLAGAGTFALCGLLVATGWCQPYDLWIDRWVAAHLHTVPWGETQDPIGYLSIWGSQYATVPVVIATVMALIAAREGRSAWLVSLYGSASGWLILLLQRLFAIPVASWARGLEAQVVYPSGHLAGATLAWGLAVAFPLRAAARRGHLPREGAQLLLLYAWLGIVGLVMVDRLAVRSHILTDLVGGFGLGLAMLASTLWLDDAFQRAPPLPYPRWLRRRLQV